MLTDEQTIFQAVGQTHVSLKEEGRERDGEIEGKREKKREKREMREKREEREERREKREEGEQRGERREGRERRERKERRESREKREEKERERELHWVKKSGIDLGVNPSPTHRDK